VIRVPDDNINGKFNSQENFNKGDLFSLIEKANNVNLTNEEEREYFSKIIEFVKKFQSARTDVFTNKKASEEKMRNHFE
jgi:hypothetical protein